MSRKTVDDRAGGEVEPIDLFQSESAMNEQGKETESFISPFGQMSNGDVKTFFHIVDERMIGTDARLVPNLHVIPNEQIDQLEREERFFIPSTKKFSVLLRRATDRSRRFRSEVRADSPSCSATNSTIETRNR